MVWNFLQLTLYTINQINRQICKNTFLPTKTQNISTYFNIFQPKYFVLIGLKFLLNSLICLELLLLVINLGIIKEIKFGSSCVDTAETYRMKDKTSKYHQESRIKGDFFWFWSHLDTAGLWFTQHSAVGTLNKPL